ncbi:MaoC/PaaZ C-terminal domain-containing protein [Pseudomonas sp. R5(2019)]|uniref:MaoC family dehydratase n=1 Tax=Pseudomonas sp. R5(2019) TaxID=2697566 RepID=UPI00141307E9|nr:MaoC/PaaZ C-terminal domain-containing protein [Pseudomonas sp. R5(2019)]NBA95062.1 acyl dehydratase [Pseudomonas sp. R5(2019)]
MSIDWHDLNAPPSLGGLYAKAARRRKISGDTLPHTGLRCTVAVDAQRLAAYRKVCEIGDSSLLPPAYPHVLAFGLHMQLLTDDAFPFPLLGLVHLVNRIRVLRPLGGLASLQLSVHVDNLQPHEKGATFDLITQASDAVGLLWEETSTVLCRHAKAPGEPPTPEEREEMPLLEATRWYAGTDIGRRYAKVSGDYNPIHLSATTARLFGFPQAIAHGMWSLARTLTALHGHLPSAGYAFEVEFLKPVRLPNEVILSASATGPSGQLELAGHGDLVHMVGGWTTLYSS